MKSRQAKRFGRIRHALGKIAELRVDLPPEPSAVKLPEVSC